MTEKAERVFTELREISENIPGNSPYEKSIMSIIGAFERSSDIISGEGIYENVSEQYYSKLEEIKEYLSNDDVFSAMLAFLEIFVILSESDEYVKGVLKIIDEIYEAVIPLNLAVPYGPVVVLCFYITVKTYKEYAENEEMREEYTKIVKDLVRIGKELNKIQKSKNIANKTFNTNKLLTKITKKYSIDINVFQDILKKKSIPE